MKSSDAPSRALRILVVGPVPPIRGGIAQHTAKLVGALQDAGHQVRIVSWRAQYPSLLYRGEQIDPHAIPFAGARFDLRWWSPAGWRRVGRRARDHDLLVLPWVHPVQMPALRTIALGARSTPVVAIVHNVTPHERLLGAPLAARLFFRTVDAAVTQADEMTEQLRRLVVGLPVRTAPHPPNLPVHPESLPARPPLRLLFMGYVRPYKGVDLLLEALSRLRHGSCLDVELTVAGELWDPSETELRQRVAALGLEGSVHLRPGYVADADVPGLLYDHHLIVGPYRTATQSGIIPIAHAAGRPVVVTPVGGLPQQVTDGENGVVADAVDPDALAAAILRCWSDLERLADGARGSVSSWDEFAAATVAVGLGEE